MKCLLYIPPFECEGTRVSNIADVRVGGISLYQRACRSIQKAGFEEIIVARPDSVQIKPDFQIIKIPIQLHEYKARLSEITQPLLDALKDEDENQSTCICVLDGMLSPECLGMRPVGADVRILTKAEPTGVYFVSYKLLKLRRILRRHFRLPTMPSITECSVPMMPKSPRTCSQNPFENLLEGMPTV